MTFRELFLKVAPMEEMRIYEPNRDCMIWETFRKTHAPYTLVRREKYIEWSLDAPNDYFENIEAIRQFHRLEELDEQTKLFLEKYADFEVHGIECGSYALFDWNDPDKELDYKPCLDVFICMPDPDHICECERCHHSNAVEDKTVYRGWSAIPDQDDAECKKCWRNK